MPSVIFTVFAFASVTLVLGGASPAASLVFGAVVVLGLLDRAEFGRWHFGRRR